MGEIEKALYRLHAAAREGRGHTAAVGQGREGTLEQTAAQRTLRGFARVSSVASGSPAAQAVSRHVQ